jgi:hypothetical protein
MQGAAPAEQLFRPGDEAPESGVYTVLHQLHRESHAATILKGERFPACAHCAGEVRFILLRGATPISDDSDFQHTTGHANR